MELMETERAHTGRVRAYFCQSPPNPDKPEITGELIGKVFSFFTNGDAGMVYDHLRQKHPEHSMDWLFVEVMGVVGIPVQREVAARKINTKVWRHRGHPVERLNWIGERPEVELLPRTGPMSLYKGVDKESRVAEAAAKVAQVFGEDRFAWT